MSSPDELIQIAVRHQQSGQFEPAESALRELLAAEPHHVRAHQLMAALHLARQNASQAIAHLQEAVRHAGERDNKADLHYDLGYAFQTAAQLDPAVQSFRAALAVDPQMAEAQTNLGMCLFALGRGDEALTAFQEAARLQPHSHQTHANLGNWYRQQGRFAEAAECYRQAITIQPYFVSGHLDLAAVLQADGKYAEAAESYRAALRLQPDASEATHDLGACLQTLGQADDAIDCFRKVVVAAPENASARLNLAILLQRQGCMAEARAEFDQWKTKVPDDARTHLELAKSLQQERRLEEAVEEFRQVLRLDGQMAEARYLLGLALLTLGDYSQAWPHFEWRTRLPQVTPPRRLPMWNGQRLAGEQVLVYADGGLGDALQFLRFVPWIRTRGGRPLLAVQDSLVGLLLQSGYEAVSLSTERWQECAWQVPIMSLGTLAGASLQNLPLASGYLQADLELCRNWKARLAELPGKKKVGIHWRGIVHSWTDRRSIPLAEFAPLAELDGVTLVSLQKNEGSEEISQLHGQFPVIELGDELDASHGAFQDTAALMQVLDVTITCDTSLAHLGGALGAPVWIALRKAADWRWLVDRSDSPWYESLRLFRQREFNRWSDVFVDLAVALDQLTPEARDFPGESAR